MMYASSVWTLCNKMLLERVLRMQKRAARIILSAPRTNRTVTLLNNLRWLPFYNEAYISHCALAFKSINGTLSSYLNTSLRKNSDNHARITRNRNLNLLSSPSQKLRGRGERKSAELSKLTHRMYFTIGWLKHDRFKIWAFYLKKALFTKCAPKKQTSSFKQRRIEMHTP